MPSHLTVLVLLLAFEEPEAVQAPAAQLQSLQKELESARRDYLAVASDTDRKRRSEEYVAQAKSIAERALQLARNNPTDPAAFDALLWVIDSVRYGGGDALRALARDHLMSERLIDACRIAPLTLMEDFEATESLLTEAMTKSPHRNIRGFACFYLAEHHKKRLEIVERLEHSPEEVERFVKAFNPDTEALRRYRARSANDLRHEAAALYRKTVAEYGDLVTRRKAKLGEIAEGELYDLCRLSVGQEAPEIEGVDIHGESLKLSDYRGKVVVLTFSGQWCGSCKRMYPQERKLMDNLRGEPFAILSVTSDAEKETIRQAIGAGEITWRCWWDGGLDGPIALRWGVNEWPTVFVLDANGVIRYRDVRDEELDAAVSELLGKLRPTKGPDD